MVLAADVRCVLRDSAEKKHTMQFKTPALYLQNHHCVSKT